MEMEDVVLFNREVKKKEHAKKVCNTCKESHHHHVPKELCEECSQYKILNGKIKMVFPQIWFGEE